MNLRLQTTLCPSCSRNTPREAEICVFCGVPTSTSTFADVAETPEAPIRAWLHTTVKVDMGNSVELVVC